MENVDIMRALKESYREVQSRRGIREIRHLGEFGNAARLRRYFLYAADILDVYLNIQRDRRYRDSDW